VTNKIVVFDVTEIEESGVAPEDVRRSRGPRTLSGDTVTRSRAGLRAFEVDTIQLSTNLLSFIDNVRDMLGQVADDAGNFSVEKVEVQAQISGEGQVGFLGSGVKASGGASIKIILERRK
jgi:hypothetical protein